MRLFQGYKYIQSVVEHINEMTEKVATIAANTEEISSQTTQLYEMAETIKEDVEQL